MQLIMKDVRYYANDLRFNQSTGKCKVHSSYRFKTKASKHFTSVIGIALERCFAKYCCMIPPSFESFITKILEQHSGKFCFPSTIRHKTTFSCASSRNFQHRKNTWKIQSSKKHMKKWNNKKKLKRGIFNIHDPLAFFALSLGVKW